MKLYAVQWLNPETGDWQTCQTFEEIDNATESDKEVACIYFNRSDAEQRLEFWAETDINSGVSRVARVKIKVKE